MSIIFSLLFALVASQAAAPGAPPDLFKQVYERGQIEQSRLKTLKATFTETTVSSLLERPIVARGTLVAEQPSRMVMRYSSPERKIVSVDERRLLVVWPDRPESEQLDITEIQKRVRQYFVRADASQLRSHFEIRVTENAEVPNTYLMDMLPQRKQIRQGLERLQLWLDRQSLLLVQMKMTFPGGDSHTIHIDKIEVNPPLDASDFAVEAVPPPVRK